MIKVSVKSLGTRKKSLLDFSIPLPDELSGTITLCELITSVVRHEIDAFQKRQHDRQFIRVLTHREINTGRAVGKIESGGSKTEIKNVDVEDAIRTALLAFEDGLYFCFVDDDQKNKLDDQFSIHSDSTMTFVRLTMLAGG